MDIELIKAHFRARNYFITLHALKRMELRLIEASEIEEVVDDGEIIEEYPNDKYGPSCLIYGKTKFGRHVHVNCSLPPGVWVITTYEPDPNEWIDFRKRRT